MDSLTQIALGAAVGTAVLGRKVGARAALWGAVCGTLPDLDVLVPYGDPVRDFTFHRAESHSLVWLTVASPFIAWVIARLNRSAGASFREWWLLAWLALVTHPLLDAFTIYGTQLLAPFSNARFALPGLGIIDPGYTVPLLLALGLAIARPWAHASRIAVYAALACSTIYLFYGLAQNAKVDAMARAQLEREGVAAAQVRVYTTIFQPWLRRITVDDAEGVRVGFASPFQSGAIAWTCYARGRDRAVDVVLATPQGRIFEWFAGGHLWAVVEPAEDGGKRVRVTDRRYGVPGPTNQGWWGVTARVDAEGRLLEGPEKFEMTRDTSRIGELFLAARGIPTELFPHAADAAQAARDCAANRIPA